jgi:hypothetical protein
LHQDGGSKKAEDFAVVEALRNVSIGTMLTTTDKQQLIGILINASISSSTTKHMQQSELESMIKMC